MTLNRARLGGQATAKVLRDAALDRYYENPAICKECAAVIRVGAKWKASETKKKRFCSRSCSARWNNVRRLKASNPAKDRFCQACRSKLAISGRAYRLNCPTCWKKALDALGNKTLWEVDRRMVYHHSRLVMKGITRQCEQCAFPHAEICHLVAISAFDLMARLNIVNARSNLKMLCPNCHWEHDHGLSVVVHSDKRRGAVR